jgi:acetyl esterase/lipase
MKRRPARGGKPVGWLAAAGLVGLSALALGAASRGRKLRKVSPALRSAALFAMPPLLPALMPLVRRATRLAAAHASVPPGVEMSYIDVPAASGSPDVRVMVLQRSGCDRRARPALLWLHGGGYVIGTPEIDLLLLARILEAIDVVIFSVDYRLAPASRFPAALNDAMAALRWVIENAEELDIDPGRIAVGGNSAGGGLAAAVAQRSRDEAIALTFQLLMYPMIDDRTACRTDDAGRGELVWTARNNRHGWAAYLGHAPGGQDIAPYAAPARCEALAGLAPAWIGVGSLDLFYEEDADYAQRLRASGVPCQLNVVADAPHAFDLMNFDTPIVRAFHGAMISALSSSYGMV